MKPGGYLFGVDPRKEIVVIGSGSANEVILGDKDLRVFLSGGTRINREGYNPAGDGFVLGRG